MPDNNKTKTLIIGNGFDLAHYLPTSYSEFIKFIKAFEKYKGDKSKVTFDEIFVDFDSDWLGNVRKYYSIENMVFDLTDLDGKLDNAWLNYFKPIQNIQTWIDFEIEISNALKMVADFCDLSNQVVKDRRKFLYFRTDDYDRQNNPFLHLSKARNLHNLKLIEEATPRINDSDKSQLIYKIQKVFFPDEWKDGSSGVSTAKIIDHLLINLNQITNIFTIYLKQIVGTILNSVRKDKLNKLDNFAEVFSLNYTTTLVSLYEEFKGEIYHLHGDIVSADKIVLGVANIDVKSFGVEALGFTKYYQTLFKETQFGFLDDYESQTQQLKGVDYYVWGHSLDRSDEKYIKRLFKEISFDLANEETIAFERRSDIDNKLVRLPTSRITIYFHSESSKARLLKNLLDIIGNEFIEKSIRTKYLRFLPSPSVWKD